MPLARWHEACANEFAVFPREDVMPVMLIVLVLQALEGLSPLTVPQFARAAASMARMPWRSSSAPSAIASEHRRAGVHVLSAFIHDERRDHES
jgi:hypothetical protein